VILAAGTGNPYFTTDTAAALRALELDADVLLMAKNRVDGIYTADPRIDPTARRYARVSHQEAFERDLRVMDASSFSLCRENNLPILVFNMNDDGAIERAVSGASVGTLVTSGEARFAEVVGR
jgi:uridylate kinase